MPDRFDFDHLGLDVRCVWCGDGGPRWQWPDDRREQHGHTHDPSEEQLEEGRAAGKARGARARRERRHRTPEWVKQHASRSANPACSNVFEPARSTTGFSSDGCRKAAARDVARPGQPGLANRTFGRTPPRINAGESRNESGGSLPSCGSCGRTFVARRSDARFCSSACRQKAYRYRNVEHP